MKVLKRIAPIVVVCLAVVGVALAVVFGMRPPHEPLPVLEAAPEFELVNQDGHTVRLSDFRGKVKVLSFMYVRCHVATQCPLTTKNFCGLQAALNAGVRDRVQFLSISFDPASDAPGVLRKYGELYGADFGNWDFLTGTKEQIDLVCDAYQIIHEKQETGAPTIRHSLITFLIDQENNVRKMYFANAWEPGDIALDVLPLLGIGENDEEWEAIDIALRRRDSTAHKPCCPSRG